VLIAPSAASETSCRRVVAFDVPGQTSVAKKSSPGAIDMP